MIVSYSHEQPTLRPTQHNSVNQADVAGIAFIGFVVVVCPTAIVLGVGWYRKYCAAVRRQQIETLEKLWRVRCKKENHERS